VVKHFVGCPHSCFLSFVAIQVVQYFGGDKFRVGKYLDSDVIGIRLFLKKECWIILRSFL